MMLKTESLLQDGFDKAVQEVIEARKVLERNQKLASDYAYKLAEIYRNEGNPQEAHKWEGFGQEWKREYRG